jgi:Flp pilus assembly protein TadB
VPYVLPIGAGVLLAVAGWLVPPRLVHDKAEARRREMRYALVSYLTLVALHRAAGQGMAAALEVAAESSSAWTFRRIGGRIDSALRAGIPPWQGLAALAAEVGIDELSDLASIADTAGTAGAGVYSTLLAKARALRNALQSDEEKTASILSARMVIPKALLGIVTLLFLLYPAVTLIGGT